MRVDERRLEIVYVQTAAQVALILMIRLDLKQTAEVINFMRFQT